VMKLKLALLSFFIFAPTIALAQSSTISATVVSSVSPSISTFVSDLSSLPADGTSLVVLTLTTKNKFGTPLPNKSAEVSSNRGEIEKIRCYDGSSLTNDNTATTDTDGVARCVASSTAPGEATFTAVVDTVTINDKPVVTFTPLPISNVVSITITVPPLLPGRDPLNVPLFTAEPPGQGQPGDKLVNTKVSVSIPFWLFLIVFIFIIAWPILLAVFLSQSRRLRVILEAGEKDQEKEKQLLERILQLEKQIDTKETAIAVEEKTIENKIDAATQPPPVS